MDWCKKDAILILKVIVETAINSDAIHTLTK